MNFRAKNFLVSVVFPTIILLFLRIAKFDGFILYGTIFVAILMWYFFTFWLYNFDVFPQGFITILLLPSIWFGSYLIIFQEFISALNIGYQLIIVGVFLVFQYYFMSTQNILNISHFRTISLSQAAYTTNNFYTILTFFVSCVALFLLPTVLIPVKLIATIPIFVVIMGTFVLLNNIERVQYIFASIIYSGAIALLLTLYVSGFIVPNKIVLLVMVLGLFFREIVVFVLYSNKKVLSWLDYLQLVIEVSGIGFLLYFSSIN